MNYTHVPLLLQPVTSLHVGCGQDVGVVDLPVIRERLTGYPFIPGSGLRGALRARIEVVDSVMGDPVRLARWLFGPKARDEEEPRFAGCLSVHDAKLLLFPVRCDRRLFIWLTCPSAIARFRRELSVFSPFSELRPPDLPVSPGDESFIPPPRFNAPSQLFCEEILLQQDEGEEVPACGRAFGDWLTKVGEALGRDDLAESALLVSDEVFSYFVQYATVLHQRNALDAAKTVSEGQLFTVEAVPPESIFFGFLGATDSRQPSSKGAASGDPGKDGEPLEAGEEEPEPTTTKPRTKLEALGEFWSALGLACEGSRPGTFLHLGGDESVGLGVTRLLWCPPVEEPGEQSGEGGEDVDDSGSREVPHAS